jgi:ABC-type polysaccharide/polyol phosphate export permease
VIIDFLSPTVNPPSLPATRNRPPGGRAQHRTLFFDLIYILTWRDIKVRYKQSVMGMMWAIFMPALIIGAGLLVRVVMGHVGGFKPNATDVASLAVKALPWAFLVTGLRFGTTSLAGNANLLTKINVPRIVFPVSAVLSALFDLLVAILPLIVILALCGVWPTPALAWAPLLLGLLVLLVTGLAILFAVGNLFLRDVKYLVEVILTFAIFFTPVLYDVAMLGDLGPWVLLNPVAPLLEGLSSAIVRGETPSLPWTLYSAACSLGVFAMALTLFARREGVFADYV